VLIVDDRADFRVIARAVLSAGGFTVIGEAATAAEAITAVTALRPEIVLLDVQLPEVDGFAVCGELRQVAPASRVVLCSVREASDYGARIAACGAHGFVTKSALSAAVLTRLATGP
jgi:DNA-binding NarL/FixJ family response regulator